MRLLSTEDQTDNSWKIQTLVIGGVLGALVGIGGAFLLTSSAEQKGTQLAITPGKGVQLGRAAGRAVTVHFIARMKIDQPGK